MRAPAVQEAEVCARTGGGEVDEHVDGIGAVLCQRDGSERAGQPGRLGLIQCEAIGRASNGYGADCSNQSKSSGEVEQGSHSGTPISQRGAQIRGVGATAPTSFCDQAMRT